MNISKPIRTLTVAAALTSLVALSGCATRYGYGYGYYGSYGNYGYRNPYYYDQPYYYGAPSYRGYYAPPVHGYAYPGYRHYDAGRYVAPRAPVYVPPAHVAPQRPDGGVLVTPPRGYHRPPR